MIEVFPGKDDKVRNVKVRNVKVRTASGEHARLVQKIAVIHPAEGDEE